MCIYIYIYIYIYICVCTVRDNFIAKTKARWY